MDHRGPGIRSGTNSATPTTMPPHHLWLLAAHDDNNNNNNALQSTTTHGLHHVKIRYLEFNFDQKMRTYRPRRDDHYECRWRRCTFHWKINMPAVRRREQNNNNNKNSVTQNMQIGRLTFYVILMGLFIYTRDYCSRKCFHNKPGGVCVMYACCKRNAALHIRNFTDIVYIESAETLSGGALAFWFYWISGHDGAFDGGVIHISNRYTSGEPWWSAQYTTHNVSEHVTHWKLDKGFCSP